VIFEPRSPISERAHLINLPLSLFIFRESKYVISFLIIPFTSVLSQLTELLVVDIFQDRLKYKAFLVYRGDEARIVLDYLQVVISPVFLCLFEPYFRSGPRFLCATLTEQSCCKLLHVYPQSQRSISLFQTLRSKDVRR